jgi:peptidoglycan/LPS O-acetylase OafA/YrhL
VPGRNGYGRDDVPGRNGYGRDDVPGRNGYGRDDVRGVPPRAPAGRGPASGIAPPRRPDGPPFAAEAAATAAGYGGSLGPLAPGGPGAQVLDRSWDAPRPPLLPEDDELDAADEAEPRPSPRRRGRARPAAPAGGAEPGPRPELPYVAGFDGLRAVALLGVLAFHQGFELARGGFLGVSSFFTLSGFLLTTLALAEWSGNGRLALGRLWEGRVRRLVPAFLFTIVLVVALQVVLRVGAGPGFRGDVLAAIGQFLNWRFVIEGDGFDSVLVNPSPVQHLWAMSLLAQLTLVLPVLFVGLMKVTGRRWRIAGASVALAAAGSFAAAWFAAESSGNDGMAYYGTQTRAGELLVGGVLAFVVLSSRTRRAIATPGGVKAVRFGAPLALVALAVLWSVTSLYSRNLFGGVTAINAVLTAWLVFAVTLPGPAATVLGSPPLRVLGRISYAAFLVHWPLYLLLDSERTGLEGIALFGVRLAATLALGAALTYGIERPFRRSIRVPWPRLGLALGVCAALVAAATLVLPEQPPRGVSLSIDDGSGAGDLDVVVPTGTSAASVALVGGSLAGDLTPGFGAWNGEHPDDQVTVHTHISPECPLSGPGPVRVAGTVMGDDLACVGFGPRLPELLKAADPDAIVVVPGVGDLGEREIDRAWVHLGDPVYDAWLVDRLDSLADSVARAGVPVLWATSPHVRLAPGQGQDGYWSDIPDNDPARVDRFNEIIRHVVAGREDFTVVDLQAWAQRLPQGEFGVTNRSEGVGLTELGATRAAAWLTPEVFEALGIELTPPPEAEEAAEATPAPAGESPAASG